MLFKIYFLSLVYHIKRAARLSGQKYLDMLHFVYFDGTSYFVDGADFVCDEDTKIVFQSMSLDKANEWCDRYNESIGL